METELPTPLDDLAKRINEEHHKAKLAMNAGHPKSKRAMNAGLQHALNAGQSLIEAKDQVKRGEWPTWLEVNCPDISRWRVRKYMRVAREFPATCRSWRQIRNAWYG